MSKLSSFLRAGLLAALLAAGAQPAAAQPSYPFKPIRLIVPLAPGGGSDIAARAVANELGQALGQPVIVENRPGAGGVLGVDVAARAIPDGYTFVFGSSTTMAANMFLYNDVSFDPLVDFVPLAMLGTIDFALVVPANSAITSVRELIDAAKAKPGALAYGYGSSAALLCGEMFKAAAGVDILQVAYKATAQSLTDLVANRIQLVCEPLGTSLPFSRDGKLRNLAVTSASRNSLAPEVPTMAQAGLPMEHSTWAGFFALAKTPQPIVDRLSAELIKVMNRPDVQQKIRDSGFVPRTLPAEAFGKVHRADIVSLEKLIKQANISAMK